MHLDTSRHLMCSQQSTEHENTDVHRKKSDENMCFKLLNWWFVS